MAVLAIGAGLALIGCASATRPVQLPAKRPDPKPPEPARSAAISPRQQVLAAYAGYTAAMTDAFASRNTASVRQILRPYLDRAAITAAIRAFSQAWERNEVSFGHVRRHILSVRIHGTDAWVHECDDATGAGLKDSRTGQVVPGSLGVREANLVTKLNLVRGHWQVWIQTVEDTPCTP